MKVWTLALLLLLGCMGLTGCGDDTDNGNNGEDLDSQGGELNKEQARRQGGRDRQGRDMCERGDWYGDGECDDFCPNPDPDCDTDNNGANNNNSGQNNSDANNGGQNNTANNGGTNNGGEPQACGSRGLPACGEGQFCLFSADSECGATDRGGVCVVRPEFCTEEYAPVCGCDGQTYSNECFAHGAGMSVAYVGECDGGNNNNPGEVACGGRLGDTCADAEFCFYDQGEGCGFADGAGVCRPRPELCTEEYAPVCGCDNQTYSNECAAHAAGVSVYQLGECGAPQERACGGLLGLSCERGEFCDYPLDAFCGAADQTGVCRPTPEACTQEYAPVCGCDGNTYGNACEANSAGTSVSSIGECEPIDDGEGRVCGSRIVSCNEGLFCLFPVEAACDQTQPIGVCTRPPDVCPRFYSPVCGCDGQTYGNECEAHRAGTSVAASGECGGPDPVSCGGRLGDTCGRGEFCLYELGDICGWADATGTCAPRPEACTREYAPVCGCDGNTYSNDCTAHVAGVSVQHVGACDEPQETLCGSRGLPSCEDGKFCNFAPEDQCGATDRPGVCEARPEFCTEEYAPVCGCDGQTYSNGCFAHMAGVSVASRGECGAPQEVLCGSRGLAECPDGQFCAYPAEAQCGANDLPGVCAVRPEACIQVYDPVCGCDGNTYGNACDAASAGVSVQHDGECERPDPGFCGGIAGFECDRGEFCNYPIEAQCGAGDQTGTCEPIPMICTQEYAPVCGCDGQTYSNACHAFGAGVSVAARGECER